jgi:nicotinamide mononucleotide (NMN) deamidase PncC
MERGLCLKVPALLTDEAVFLAAEALALAGQAATILPAKSCTGLNRNPIALVYSAVVRDGGQTSMVQRNYGDIGRDAIRMRAIGEALSHLTEMLLRKP